MMLNNGVQFLSALFFPIVVGGYGFHAMFFIWAGCTVIYFITAAFFLPETKGRSLEEIEDYFRQGCSQLPFPQASATTFAEASVDKTAVSPATKGMWSC